MIVGAQKCMLFEPSSASSQKFLDLVLPRLAASDSERARFALRATGQAGRHSPGISQQTPTPLGLRLCFTACLTSVPLPPLFTRLAGS